MSAPLPDVRPLIVCLVAAAVLAAGALLPTSARAERPGWVPEVDPFLSSSLRGYRASACECFDRWSWTFEAGLGLRWHRFIQIEGGLRSGGLWFPRSGHFPNWGFRVGARTALTPESSAWWDDFYVRAGYTRYSVATAQDKLDGVYLHPGWSLEPIDDLHFDPELVFEYNFGTMANFQLGLQLLAGYRF